jgi:mono/diheme cytochrome c family protein
VRGDGTDFPRSGPRRLSCDDVTEIPEHLLKRSRERRASLGGDDAPADASAPAAADAPGTAVAPAAAAKAAAPAKVAPVGPPPAKPDPPSVVAYKKRKKIPVWAMMTLSILPLWGFMYVRALTPGPVVVHGPLGDGAKVFAGVCATCHGADGSGGVGRPLNNGAVLKTFPHIEDQLNLVYTGSQAYAIAGLKAYGDPALGHLGFNNAYMPAQGGALTEAEILAVVCDERYNIGGADPASPAYSAEYATWCAEDSPIYAGLQDGSITFDNITTTPAGKGVLPIGTKPRAGTGAS